MIVSIVFSAEGQSKIIRDSLLHHVEVLSSDEYEGRKTETPANFRAAEYIEQRFRAIGLDQFGDTYIHPFKFHSRIIRKVINGNNLLAWIPGSGQTDQYIVLSAHYDHVGVRNNAIYNGADDNASGVGALLEIARYLQAHPPRHNVVIAAFDAEEMGLRGADAFVEDPPISLEKIVLNINMDMISRNEQEELFICGTSYTPQFRQLLVPVISQDSSINVSFGHEPPDYSGIQDWTGSSDHGKFHAKGIPFLYFGVEDHEDYHQPTDDFERINPSFYYRVTNFILDSFIAIDQQL
jgi:Zn-dependent M28 family amino/carboxypeptidase